MTGLSEIADYAQGQRSLEEVVIDRVPRLVEVAPVAMRTVACAINEARDHLLQKGVTEVNTEAADKYSDPTQLLPIPEWDALVEEMVCASWLDPDEEEI